MNRWTYMPYRQKSLSTPFALALPISLEQDLSDKLEIGEAAIPIHIEVIGLIRQRSVRILTSQGVPPQGCPYRAVSRVEHADRLLDRPRRRRRRERFGR